MAVSGPGTRRFDRPSYPLTASAMPTPASPLPIRDDAAFDRRAVLGLAASGAALLAAGPAQAQGFTAGAIQAALGEGQKFNPSTVIELARLLSKRPYNPPSSELPDPFNRLPTISM